MAKSCAIIPQVRNKNGEIVDSKLFTDLLSFTSNRAEAVRLYQITKSQQFAQQAANRVTMDDNGEPTIKSLFDNTNINSYISEKQVLDKLNKDIGHYERGKRTLRYVPNTTSNYNSLIEKAIEFNNNSEFSGNYVATVNRSVDAETGKKTLNIEVQKRTKERSAVARKMEYNQRLNARLREILNSKGVAIGALTELENRQGAKGVTDFDLAKQAAEGLVELIRLADGAEGEEVLPEEFAHFALEALGDNPLVNRLVNLIASNGLAEKIIGDTYDSYVIAYKGNEVMLAKEAAGKLLADHLLRGEEIQPAPYKNILQRLITAIKNFLRRINPSSIKQAMAEADREMGRLAKDILNGRLDEEINIRNIAESEKFYNLTDRIARDKRIAQSIIDNELKRLKIYENRNPNSQFSMNQRLLIDRLELELADNNEIEGIYTFMENALERLRGVSRRLAELQNTPATDTNERAKVLRDVRNYLYSYREIFSTVREALLEEEKLEDNRYGDRIRNTLKDASDLLDDLYSEYKSVAMPLFVDFMKMYLGESIVVPFGKYKGKVIKAEKLLGLTKRDLEEDNLALVANEDISFFDRWLDSMADSSSYILKVMDQAVKQSKERGRLRTIEYRRKLEAAGIKLEQAGVKNMDWMFETDSKGNKTGRYISEIDFAKYSEAKKKMYEDLQKKYGENPVGEDADKFKAERKAWYDANTETIDGKKQPKASIYGNEDFKNLSDAKREFYDTIMEIKSELDSLLPEKYTSLLNTVKIRKDLIERVKSSKGVRDGGMQIWEAVKDQFIRRGDDTEFGDKATVKDFEGNEVQVLPVYYTKLREGESNNDISTDVISTMMAYAAMATDFDEMNKVIHLLETSRDLLRDELNPIKTRGGKPLTEKFTSVGRKVESIVTKGKDNRRIIQRLDDFFEMQVYGRYMADEGTFGNSKIDKGKTANFVNRITSLNMLGLNLLSGISNVATGKVMMRIESFAGQFFNEKDTIAADRIYGKALTEYLGDVGKRVKTSKLALWDELFNVMQEYETNIKDSNFDRKVWYSRMFNSSALFVLNNAGEHWMQNRTSLALAHRYKMKAPDGKIVNLWDAMEVVYTDPNNKKLGASLRVKEGYTKEDGTEFTQQDIIKFSRKSAAINQRMHGIYNKLDRSAVQRLALGRMAIMFRKWIKPSLNRRFKSATKNLDLDEWTEGYYRTTARFLGQIAKELKEGQFALVANWKNLDETEKANIKRAATEVGHFLLLLAFLGLMDWGDKDRPWLEKMIEYQARRLYTELGAFVPGPQMINEGFTILKSPAAGIRTMEGSLDLIGLLNPYNYEIFGGEEALLQSGRYKGHSRAYRLFFESPVVPMNKTIYRGLHPEESIPFYKQ